MTENKIIDLFPTPLYITNINEQINPRYKEYLLNIPTIANMGNTRSEDGYILNDPMFGELKEFIKLNIKEYIIKIYGDIDLDVYITQSWANCTGPKQFHHKHHHPNSFLSGVFYINAVNGEDMIKFYKDKPSLFDIHAEKANNYNSQDVVILVETGDLIIFPSNFMHEVPPTTSNETRISIAFNTFIRGRIGDDQRSTALYLS
jgi:uncharacterized protein (TIGR02466 family)